MKKLFLVLGLLAAAQTALASVEKITYQLALQDKAGEPAIEPGVRSAWVETVEQGGDQFKFFYDSVAGAPRLVAIERYDAATGEISAFRHRFESQGEVRWTPWMSGKFRAQAQVSWPDVSGKAGSATQEISRVAVTGGRALHALQSERIEAEIAASLAGTELMTDIPKEVTDPFSLRVDWRKDAEYTWEYNQSKFHRLWVGYLWDYRQGKLWRGYREPKKKGTILTPSQQQSSSDESSVQRYYERGGFDISKYNASNTRNLSPLDKWGIYANRKYGQRWWDAAFWEGTNKHTNFKWGGYCNASVASGLLFKKPEKMFVAEGVEFDPRDMVGILQSATWRVDFLWFGERCDKGSCDKADPKPTYVVDLIDQYVGRVGTPLAVDLEADENVGNETIISAKLKVMEGDKANERYVELTVKSLTNFEDIPTPEDEIAQHPYPSDEEVSTNTWGFKVTLNNDGTIKGQKWDDNAYHPDFLWLPTAVGDYDDNLKNPRLKMDWVKELVNQSY